MNHTKRWMLVGIVLLVLLLGLAACGDDDGDDDNGADDANGDAVTPTTEGTGDDAGDGNGAAFTLSSPAFAAGEPIPEPYTCDGEDISPTLAWEGAPEGTQSFALIVDDPDAPSQVWVHWVIFNLPGDLTGLPEGAGADDAPGVQGQTSWTDRAPAYYGPCPPSGDPHRYIFTLYALDTTLDLEAGATKADVLSAMEGHVLADAQLVGTYQR
jgi:Raf kinase inhibitor-like YbhB/YbcL family protein